MNPPKKKKTTITFDWSFSPTIIISRNVLTSSFFGTPRTQFHLEARKKTCSLFALSLHLDSSVKSELSFNGNLKYSYTNEQLNKSILGDVSQSKEFEIPCPFVMHTSFQLKVELTFEEPRNSKKPPLDYSAVSLDSPFDHSSALLDQLYHLRRDSSLADITLVSTVDGKEFPAHKSILSARSTVFAAMFSHSQLKENQIRRVEIEDVSGEVLKALLKYVYECDVKGIEPIAGDLLFAANKYDIPLLVAQCAQSIINNLEVSNAAYYFYLASLHQFENLKTQIGKFIVENKRAVRQSDGFKQFIQSDPSLQLEIIDLFM